MVNHTTFVAKQEQEAKKWIFEMDADLDKRFREAIAKKSGLHRGVIKKALADAIEDWIKKPKEKE